MNVKLTSNGNGELMRRLTPGRTGAWQDFQFHINDSEKECDWWVVYDGLAKEEAASCPRGRKIFVTAEPPAIKKYDPKFLAQFDLILTSQPGLKGSNVIRGQTGLPWTLYSQDKKGAISLADSKDYDWLKAAAPEKTKLFSAVTSNKRWTKGHRERLDFITKLQAHFKDKLDIFGPGQGINADPADPIKFKYHENKWEALAGYKYSLAIENSSCPDYWTEKISDAYLADCHPIYFGCPNITDYFPAESLTIIDIHKPDEAIRIIEEAIAGGAFEKSAKARKEAKELVLEKYQLFPLLAETFKKLPGGSAQSTRLETNEEKVSMTIKPESSFMKPSIMRRLAQRAKRDFRKASTWLILRTASASGIDLLFLAYNKMGILNFKDLKRSGEEFLLNEILPKSMGSDKPVLFDVGAHVGEYSTLLREAFPSAKIFSFEPSEAPFQALKKISSAKKLDIHQVALSSESGDAEIYYDKSDPGNQLASLHRGVISDLHRAPSTSAAKVRTTSIDDFCAQKNIGYIDFLKIDTEGHELEVLRGAHGMIENKKIGMIQFEFNEMNVISRVFLKDFYDVLSNFDLYRLNEGGLIDIRTYDGRNEIFKFQNIVAMPKK